MKQKQRFLVFIVSVLSFVCSIYAQQSESNILQSEGVITLIEFQQAKTMKAVFVHPTAQNAMRNGEKKGEFQNVTYTLSPKVRMLTSTEINQMDVSDDGILKINKAGGKFVPSPDFIYFDDKSDLIFESTQVNDDQMIITRPKLYEIFEDIEIPEQEVPMTLANTTETASGMQISSTGGGENYAVHLKFDSITYKIDTINITLIGEITLTQPRVEGRYSKNNGYSLVFKTSERVDLRAKANVKLSKEKKIPIWGTEIPVKNIGKCELGVFAVINVEGEVTLVVDVHQGIDVALGARGGTFYYIPTSIHNASEFSQFCEVEYDVKAKMKAFAGVECTAKLKFKSYNVLDVYIRGGMEGTVESDLKTLSADVGVRFKAGGKIVSKKFTLVDKYYSLWKIQKPDMLGYKMNIDEACAFGDYVAGNIQKTEDGDNFSPYNGSLKIVVLHSNGTKNEFNGQTGDDGIFLVKNVPLIKTDKVAIKLANVNNLSPYMEPTIPFKEINLTAVDYFTGSAYGSVASFKSKWYKLATQSQPTQNQGATNTAISKIAESTYAAKAKSIVSISNSEFLKRVTDFKNNTLAYNGEVKFISRQKMGTSNTGNKVMQRTSNTQTTGKPKQNRGYINNPFGFFEIDNLELSPNQEIKARIQLEGFTIESEWIETDGLLISEIEPLGTQISRDLYSETVTTENNFVIVSAIRGKNAPTGKVRLLYGAGMPHCSVTGTQTVPDFPDAKKAIVFLDKTVSLTPVAGNEGTAIAETGTWTYKISFTKPGENLLPAKNGKHPFEKVTYVFKGADLGYEYFLDECRSCKSPENLIEKVGLLQNERLNGKILNVDKKLTKQLPKVNPNIGGGIMR